MDGTVAATLARFLESRRALSGFKKWLQTGEESSCSCKVRAQKGLVAGIN
jgi:hypothetical protein